MRYKVRTHNSEAYDRVLRVLEDGDVKVVTKAPRRHMVAVDGLPRACVFASTALVRKSSVIASTRQSSPPDFIPAANGVPSCISLTGSLTFMGIAKLRCPSDQGSPKISPRDGRIPTHKQRGNPSYLGSGCAVPNISQELAPQRSGFAAVPG